MNLISHEYRELNRSFHAGNPSYGNGRNRALYDAIIQLADALQAKSVLDYGCGKGGLGMYLRAKTGLDVREYDPAIAGKEAMPEAADIVTCLDVLEHVEPDMIEDVLDHLRNLTGKVALLAIGTLPALKTLPDGRNAHLIVEGQQYWVPKIVARWNIKTFTPRKHDLVILAEKR